MHFPIKTALIGLILAVMLPAVGCGRKSAETQPTTSIEAEKNPAKNSNELFPPKTNSGLKYSQAVIETSLGAITIQLDQEKTPLTVDNFLGYVNAGLYDQTIFHQVYKDQAILAGGFAVNFSEIRPGRRVKNEARNASKNTRGTIAMLRQPDVIDSATSQFFINVADNPALDYTDQTADKCGYCVFGKVVGGMDVVDRIASSQVKDSEQFDSTPVQAVVIKSVRRVK